MKKQYKHRFLFLVLFGSFLTACFDGDGHQNKPENKAAHGHKEGEVNQYRIGDTLLRIPADVSYTPLTNNKKVEKGHADQIRLGLHYPELYQSSVSTHYTITIKLFEGTEVENVWEKHLSSSKWRAVIERPEWNLVEYQDEKFDGGWGYITLKTADSSFYTPIKKNPVYFRCQGYPPEKIIWCRSSFGTPEKIKVTYTIPVYLLSHWQKIHRDVETFVSSLIIKSK